MITSNAPRKERGGDASEADLHLPIDENVIRAVLGCIADSRLIILYRPDIGQPAMWWSPGSARLLGYESAELESSIGALHALVHPDDLPALLDRAGAIASEDAHGDFAREYRLKRKHGEYVWVRSIISTYRPPDAQQSNASLEVLRVQEPGRLLDRAALKLSEDALNTVLNEIGHPVVLMDAAGLIVQANEAAERFSRTPSAQKGFCPFLHLDDGRLLFPGFLEDVIRLGQPASQELERFERWWRIHLVPIRDGHQDVARVLLLAEDITDIKTKQAVQLERERALRDTLVREVHHRIKNHLQGLIGLLRRQGGTTLSGAQQMHSAVAQIQTIASIHGLLAKGTNASVDLASLVREIISANQLPSPVPVHMSCEQPALPPFELSENESIPFAVALGELLINAMKHTVHTEDAQVTVALSHRAGLVVLTITNSPAFLPPGFHLEEWAGGQSGLALVLTLLSHRSVRFTLEQQEDRVLATLELKSAQA